MNVVLAQNALQLMKLAVIDVLIKSKDEGMRNCDVARTLELDFGKTYFTWEILQLLVEEGLVTRVKNRYYKKKKVKGLKVPPLEIIWSDPNTKSAPTPEPQNKKTQAPTPEPDVKIINFGEYRGFPMNRATLIRNPEYWRDVLDSCEDMNVDDPIRDWLVEGYRNGYI